MKGYRISAVLLITGIIATVSYFTWILVQAGTFRQLTFHQPGPCRPVLGVFSSEDIVIDPVSGLAFISSLARRIPELGEPIPGQILSYDLNNPTATTQEASENLAFEFFPHGLGLWRSPEGTSELYAVNHRSEGDTIEIFETNGEGLIHTESISGDLLFNANDIAPVADRQFYVTRDHGSPSGFGRHLEDYLLLRRASVLFYDGSDFRVVADGIGYANGITVSPDGLSLYVGATTEGAVHIYSRDPASGDLALRQTLSVDTGVDNLSLDSEGALWLAGHPKLLTFVEYAENRDTLSPSQVLRIDFRGSEGPQVDEIHLSDGSYLSGSSVAVHWQDSYLVGSVFDQRFLICPLGETLETEGPSEPFALE